MADHRRGTQRELQSLRYQGQMGRCTISCGAFFIPEIFHRIIMLKRTPLNEAHRAMGAKMVDFGGWDMPVNYGSQIDEHLQVRNDCGMFDVSHMRVVDIKGKGVRDFLRYLLANNVDKLTVPGKALYSCMLLENGGVIDDLIVYFMEEQWFRIVVNAGTADKDIARKRRLLSCLKNRMKNRRKSPRWRSPTIPSCRSSRSRGRKPGKSSGRRCP